MGGWGFQERFNLYCSVVKLLGDRAIVEFVSAWPSSCLAVDLEVLKHDVLLSSCLAGSSVAFGRQAAWRAAAFVDELCHQAAWWHV